MLPAERNRLAAIASWRDPVIRARRVAAMRSFGESRLIFLRLKMLTLPQLDRLGGESNARAAEHALRDVR